jgi:multidrug efflux pump subunit AcrA (membrane-fusion protein)
MADTLISPPEPTPSESPETGNDHDYELPAQKSSIGSISQKLLLDVLIPAGLLMGGIAVLLLLGTAQTEKKPRIGTDYRSRMEALSEVRVQRLQTLASLGEQLQLVVDGSVVPFREAKVAAEVAGKIESKTDNCEAGAYVEANELLMTIDPTDYELEVEQLTQLKNQESQSLRKRITLDVRSK